MDKLLSIISCYNTVEYQHYKYKTCVDLNFHPKDYLKMIDKEKLVENFKRFSKLKMEYIADNNIDIDTEIGRFLDNNRKIVFNIDIRYCIFSDDAASYQYSFSDNNSELIISIDYHGDSELQFKYGPNLYWSYSIKSQHRWASIGDMIHFAINKENNRNIRILNNQAEYSDMHNTMLYKSIINLLIDGNSIPRKFENCLWYIIHNERGIIINVPDDNGEKKELLLLPANLVSLPRISNYFNILMRAKMSKYDHPAIYAEIGSKTKSARNKAQ